MKEKEAQGGQRPPRSTAVTHPDPEFREFIRKTLDDSKAVDIVTIDLAGKTSIADYMVIATGTSARHVKSMADKVKDEIKKHYGIHSHIEGKDGGDWVIVDAKDAIIHVFRQEVREFYNLEKLWGSDFSTVNYTLYK